MANIKYGHLYGGALKYVGGIGGKGQRLAKIAGREGKNGGIATRALQSRGRRNAMMGGGGLLGLGMLGRSSGASGLQPRSSAPPPSDPMRPY